jgi:hypothetical protein
MAIVYIKQRRGFMASNFQSSIIGQNADQGLVSNDQLYNTVMRGAFSLVIDMEIKLLPSGNEEAVPMIKFPKEYRVAQLDQFYS